MAEPANTPIPSATPRASSPSPRPSTLAHDPPKPRVLHIGDPIKYNPDTYAALCARCDVVRPTTPERQRPSFVAALAARRWGDFDAVLRPFWGSGGEMGRWDAELVDLLPASVRVFASAGAGFDWADTKLLGERGIVYCNSGIAAADAVADFAVAMIIATFRHIPKCTVAAASGSTAAFQACHAGVTAQAHNLAGQRLGLVGLGQIGEGIAARCHAGFGMRVHYYDVAPKTPPAALHATAHADLAGLLGAVDCVVLCAPAGPGGGGPLISAAALQALRRGGRFVNVARGALVDEDALVDALDAGRLASAALDVYAAEPSIHPGLLRLAAEGRVMLTCHNAGGTVETHRGFEEVSMRNVMAVLGGEEALTPVNLQYLKRG